MSKAVVLVALAACGTTTYSYQYKSLEQFGIGEQPEAAPREARELLANAKTVAFYPPDQCVNSDPSQARAQQIRARCGVMMSALEHAAEEAGYEVLSWQNLRGSKRAIEYAQESHVDVLFEVNDLEAEPVDDVSVKHTFTFTDGDDKPLDVSTSLAETCRDYAFKADPPRAAALAGRVDIKTVSVADGRDRWHYTKTEDRGLDRAYPRVSFAAPNRPDKLTRVLMTLGAVGLGIGGGLYLAEVTSSDDPTTPTINEKFDSGGWSTNFMVIGAAATVAAIAVGVAGGGDKPPVATTLCNANFAVAASAAPARPEVMSSEHTFEHTAAGDPLDEARRALIGEMTQQFIDELKSAHAMKPRTGPAPEPSPAPPPVPAAVPSPAAPAPPAPAHP
jgi:hypothetical protein